MTHRFKKTGRSIFDDIRELKPGDIKTIAIEDAVGTTQSYRTAVSNINSYLGRKRYEISIPRFSSMIILKDNG